MDKKQKITKESRINEVVSQHPETVDILMQYGLHCIGCGMSSFENIEQGAMAHGMDKQTINDMIKDANKVIESGKVRFEGGEMLKITERAVKRVIELKDESGEDYKYLRIKLIETPYGNRYGFKFEKRKKKNDFIIGMSEVGFLIDKKDLKKMKGATMDYLSFLPGNGFKIYSAKKNG